MRKKTITIRVDPQSLKEIKRVLPAKRGESKQKYLTRFVHELNKMGLKGFQDGLKGI